MGSDLKMMIGVVGLDDDCGYYNSDDNQDDNDDDHHDQVSLPTGSAFSYRCLPGHTISGSSLIW